MSRPSVGFVGLGTIGAPMARCIKAAGFELAVYDIDEAAVASLVELRARFAPLPELARLSDVVLIAVVTEEQVVDVLGTHDGAGVFAGSRSGTLVVVHSTVHPEAIRRASAAAPEGVAVLDAPVTGNAEAAAEGRLSVLAGGDEHDLARLRPVFDTFATRVTHVGSTGAGAVAKIANNLAITVTIRAVREALKVSGAYGVDEDVMLDLLTTGGADSWVARNWRHMGRTASSYPGGAAGVANLVYKDASLALQLAHDRDLEIPTLAVAAQLMLDAHRAAEDGAARPGARD